jgi:dipeptidyl aminopeptidase/acylaminoacyl peptidase
MDGAGCGSPATSLYTRRCHAGADGTLFALQSDGNQPLHPVVLSAGGQWRRLAPEAIPSFFPSSSLVMPQAVTFAAKDGQETHAQLLLPRDVSVAYAGIYNWSTFLASVGEPIDGDDANRRAVESSPIATIDQWRSPVLLVKADGDLDVPLQQSTALIEDLRSHNIDHDVIVIPNEIHVMTRYASWMTLFHATDAYLGRDLDKRTVPTPQAAPLPRF